MTKTEGKRTIWAKLENADFKYVMLVLIIFLIANSILPITFPFERHESVIQFYNYLQSLQPGSVVCFDEGTIISTPEYLGMSVYPQIYHLFKLPGVKIVFVSFYADGPLNVQNSIKMLPAAVRDLKKYGEDYVILGYAPGFETAIASFARDIRSIFPRDIFGTSTDDIPMMKTIRSAADFTAVRARYQVSGLIDAAIRVYYGTYGKPMFDIISPLQWSTYAPYVPRIIVAQFLDQYSHEYEALLGYVGINMKRHAGTNLLNALFIIMAVVANVGWYMNKRASAQVKVK